MGITETVRQLTESWLVDDDVRSVQDINNGLCADFANALADLIPFSEIHGIYDERDISEVPGEFSKEFREAVSAGMIGHTAIFIDGLFYDSEAPNGVPCFEQLPLCQRAFP
ncbi:hypothetical protein [Marinimicrobium sp. ABcell2]|uniref:hypothetical protein n=1 Tax=Marinimicrobium sp. ABcell2 TaxID=3069751 RepID=UPI0027B330DA|nr:hypothetical protein [Marinimicrobium sp. ABcell2]MDQ2077449.1 hypothetical protein [Marinimicrobium sp. ABcell2]